MKFVIVCIVKDEFDYILEWLAYHRKVIGVVDFIIADNVSGDGTTQLLEALDQADYIQRVHFPRVNQDKGIQADAYNHIIKKYGKKYDYMAFIDADEFIVNKTGLTFKALLKKLTSERECGAVAMHWRNFGSSGAYYQTNDLVTERFTWASRNEHKYNHHIKTILKPSCATSMQIHHCELKDGKSYYDIQGKSVFIDNLKDKNVLPLGDVSAFTDVIKNTQFYVAHFVVKSKDEHMRKKAKRGSAAGLKTRQKGMDYFKGHDLNQEECHDLFFHVEHVKNEITVIKNKLKKNGLFYRSLRVNIDKFDRKLVGWVGLQGKEKVTIKVLVNGIDEQCHQLSIKRPDVLKAGISSNETCGFSIDLSSYNKNQLKVWIEGSNAILWDGDKGY